MTDENREIIQVAGGFRRPKSDIEIYCVTRLAKGWQEKPKIADKAYAFEKIQVSEEKAERRWIDWRGEGVESGVITKADQSRAFNQAGEGMRG